MPCFWLKCSTMPALLSRLAMLRSGSSRSKGSTTSRRIRSSMRTSTGKVQQVARQARHRPLLQRAQVSRRAGSAEAISLFFTVQASGERRAMITAGRGISSGDGESKPDMDARPALVRRVSPFLATVPRSLMTQESNLPSPDDIATFRENILRKLTYAIGKDAGHASQLDWYEAVALATR